MKKITKISLWILTIGATALLSANYLAPRLINSDLLKDRIESAFSIGIDGEVKFSRIDLAIFPRPYVTIHDGEVKVELAAGSVKSLSVYPRLLPLFIGKLQASKVLIDSPDIKVSMPSQLNSDTDKKPAPPLAALVDSLVSYIPGLDLEIKNGSLDFNSDTGNLYLIEGIGTHISFPSSGKMRLTAELSSSNMQLNFQRDGQEVPVNASDLKARIYYDDDKWSVSLKKLALDYPELKLSGGLSADSRVGKVNLSIEARDMDVQSTRETALLLAGQIPVTKQIFRIVRGGHIPLITFISTGDSFGALDDTENFVIKGEMENGEIFIQGVDLELKEVKGDVIISKGILEGENLETQLGNSSGKQAKLKVGLEGKDPPFNLDIMVQADLAELHPLLKHVVNNKEFVDELSLIDNPKGNASGRLILGDSLKSVKARVEATDLNLSANYQRIPYPLNIRAKRFYYDNNEISVEGMSGKVAKSSVSGINFHIGLTEGPLLEISSGRAIILLDETYPWFSELTNLPPESYLLSPLSINRMNLVWDRGNGTVLKGDFSLQNNTALSFDLVSSKEGLHIKSLAVKDNSSDAVIGLDLKEDQIDISFNGTLTRSTVDNIISDNKILNGWVKGDFQAHIQTDKPIGLTAQGTLEGRDINLLVKLKEPVYIESLSLDAENNKLKVVSADIDLGETSFTLKGDIISSKEGLLFDTDMSAGKLEWDKLENAFAAEEKDKDAEYFYDFPIKGIIRLNSDSFTYDKFTWEPFKADITFSQDNIDVAVIESSLCNISFPGNIKFTPQELSLAFQPISDDKDLKSAIACLWGTSGHMTGSYRLKSTLTGTGKGDEIIESLSGDLTLSATAGRIYKGGLLAKAFAFLNFTEILRGALPDLVNEGFAYKTIEAELKIEGSTLNFERVVIDGSSMNIVSKGKVDLVSGQVDLEVLMAPLKTVDFILGKIPLIKDITKGSLVSIPLKITGDIDSPKIVYIPASAVSSSIFSILKGTLEAPVKIIQPVLSNGAHDK